MLTQFYKDILSWVMAGCPEEKNNPHGFTTRFGLCNNLYFWCLRHNKQAWIRLSEEQELAFEGAGLSAAYPFNGSEASYSKEQDKRQLYQNPRRLSWITEHAN